MKWGCTNGIFAVWKPPGMLSTSITNKIRQALMGKASTIPIDKRILREFAGDYGSNGKRMWLKIGHGGILDCQAEGIVVVGVGRSCKELEHYTRNTDKTYLFKGELGKTTETLDRAGEVIKMAPWEHITLKDLENVLKKFQGAIAQVPPLYSAKKFNGMRMSDIVKKAARDESIVIPDRPPVQVSIKSLKLLEFQPPAYTISALCSSGTYVRSLARDIGESLGTVSYCTFIVRTAQGEFSRDNALAEEDWTCDMIEERFKYYNRCIKRARTNYWQPCGQN